MTTLVDAHCHVMDLADPPAAIRRALDSGVVIVGVTNHAEEFQAAKRRFVSAKNVRLAAGLHPLLAARLLTRDVLAFVRAAEGVDYIGEVGLDYSRDGASSKAQQQTILDQILGEPRLTGKVWSFHSRRADTDLLSRLEHPAIRLTPVLHWFTGPATLVDRAVAAGCYFSINESMLVGSRAGQLLGRMPRDRVLTETDAPYGRHAGRANAPSDIVSTVHRLAGTWDVTVDEAREQVYANMAAAFAAARA
jgi:TatD DNase family protein